jgi:hypothetical protein
MRKRLRYADLRDLGIVNNRVTLSNWIKDLGFPRGQLIGPNTRVWTEVEVSKWLDKRPSAMKPTPRSPGRSRKADHAGVEA